MKNVFKIFVLVAFMIGFMNVNVYAQDLAMAVVSVDTKAADYFNKNNNVAATGEKDSDLPHISYVNPGVKVPTIGELKQRVLDYIESQDQVAYANQMTDFKNYLNTGREAWNYTYTMESTKNPGYMFSLVYRFSISKYDTGRVSISNTLIEKYYTHIKTGEVVYP